MDFLHEPAEKASAISAGWPKWLNFKDYYSII
jgi:hypothetical protein